MSAGAPPPRPVEDSFAAGRRIDFVVAAVRAAGAASVLDIGCGTGWQLTRHVAAACPGSRFLGIDSDAATIAFAERTNRQPNLSFATALPGDAGPFDLVVASEVIEHVEEPDRFLADLKGVLAPGGAVVLTVPNGYGPSEWASMAECLAHMTGLTRLLRLGFRSARFVATGRWTANRAAAADAEPDTDTLAVSPHLNFFSHRAIRRLVRRAGFAIEAERNRMFLCGFGLSSLVDGFGLARWNAAVADRLPPALTSDWMFVLRPAAPEDAPAYRRGPLARLRRRFNERRWRVPAGPGR